MQFVPDKGSDESEKVSGEKSDGDESDCGSRIEWFDHVNGLNHVRPENEIDHWLRETGQNEQRPENVPAADQQSKK